MNDKKKSKRFNKKLGGILLIVIVCAICLNFLGMYVYKSMKKEQDYLNYDSSTSEEIADSIKCTYYTNKYGGRYKSCVKSCSDKSCSNLKTRYASGPAEGSLAAELKKDQDAKENKKKYGSYTTKQSGQKKAGLVAGRNDDEDNFEGVHVNSAGDYGLNYVGATCGDKACSFQSARCESKCTMIVEAVTKDSNVKDEDIRWLKNGVLISGTGRNLKVNAEDKNAVYTPCIVGKSCPGGTNDKDKPKGGGTTKKTNGAKKND